MKKEEVETIVSKVVTKTRMEVSEGIVSIASNKNSNKLLKFLLI